MNHYNHRVSSTENRASRIEYPVIYVPIRHSTLVENPLQIDLFMQNKPKVKYAKMNVKYYSTNAYENKSNWTLGQNKPNSNPIKPNLQKSKMNVNSFITKDYRKNDDFLVRINKPNLRNSQNERKRFFTKGL